MRAQDLEELIMTNILLINTNCSWNKGSAAQVVSTTKTLGKLIPDAKFTLASQYPELDLKPCKEHNIKVSILCRDKFYSRLLMLLRARTKLLGCVLRCVLWSSLCKIGLNANKLIDEEILRVYSNSDLIIDLSGDTLSDKNCFSIFSIFNILIGILLKKKIAIFSQSIGPFRKITMPLARFCLNRASLILVREDVTKNYLKHINVNNPFIYLGAEIAFLLEQAHPKKVQEIFLKESINPNKKNRPLIGIGPNALVYQAFRSNKAVYVTLMAKIADFLVEKFNAQIVFVSHVIIPPEYGCQDDRFVAKEIYQLVRNKNRIKIIKEDYSPEELKGIIARCELFIGARMHSNIASTSTHVPTIALAWSHKYRGIMRMLEQEKYVCDIETITFDELVSKINDAWNNKDEIEKKLAFKTTELKKSALHNCRIVTKLVKPAE